MKITGWIATFALLIGTVGLLSNEFVFHWGRGATITFAACSVLGLVILITSWLHKRDQQHGKKPEG